MGSADNTKIWYPLEELFFKRAKKKNELYHGQHDYVARYRGRLSTLRASIYPHVDSGLSALSREPGGIYTRHDSEHFDYVVQYAGSLLGLESSSLKPLVELNAQELYSLLLAIRVHDAGNLTGREEHDRRAISILSQIEDEFTDAVETHTIGQIAQAHGGKTDLGSQDTIGELPEIEMLGNTKVRMRMLAAITRFADEICEYAVRAATPLLADDQLPAMSAIYHHYANAVKASQLSNGRTLHLNYVLDLKHLAAPILVEEGDKQTSIFLVDYILERLAKINRERIYYNQFVEPALKVYGIDARLGYVQGFTSIHQETIRIEDGGYPSSAEHGRWREKYPDISGQRVKERFASPQPGAKANATT